MGTGQCSYFNVIYCIHALMYAVEIELIKDLSYI